MFEELQKQALESFKQHKKNFNKKNAADITAKEIIEYVNQHLIQGLETYLYDNIPKEEKIRRKKRENEFSGNDDLFIFKKIIEDLNTKGRIEHYS